MARRSVASLMVAALLITACSDDDAPEAVEEVPVEEAPVEEPEPEPDPEPEPEPEADPEPAEGFPIDQPVTDPSVIDEEYVERVLQAMDELLVVMVEDVQTSGEWTPEASLAVQALYSPEARGDYLVAWQEIIELGFVEEPPTASPVRVRELISRDQTCISVVADRHWDTFYDVASPFPQQPTWLVGLTQDVDAKALGNPGVWVFAEEAVVNPDSQDFSDVCT